MDFMYKELDTIKSKWHDTPEVQLIACVPAMVRFKIIKTRHKTLDACFIFPDDYPQQSIVMELKSKFLSDKLLDGLTKVCEEAAKKLQGQRQIMLMVEFISKFIDDHPLCVCNDEIAAIKHDLLGEDEMKLKQKTSQVVLKLKEGNYYISARITVPDDYPFAVVGVDITDQNFPGIFQTNIASQAVEIARQCVQPPLKKKKPRDPPFQPTPALRPISEYLVEATHTLPTAMCPCCGEVCLPANPKDVVTDHTSPGYVHRIYCKHLFHYGCLSKYMKTPPFKGGKKCPACGSRIYHEKWKISPQLAEARWAHKEARNRELSEVVDFMQ